MSDEDRFVPRCRQRMQRGVETPVVLATAKRIGLEPGGLVACETCQDGAPAPVRHAPHLPA